MNRFAVCEERQSICRPRQQSALLNRRKGDVDVAHEAQAPFSHYLFNPISPQHAPLFLGTQAPWQHPLYCSHSTVEWHSRVGPLTSYPCYLFQTPRLLACCRMWNDTSRFFTFWCPRFTLFPFSVASPDLALDRLVCISSQQTLKEDSYFSSPISGRGY